MPPADAPFDVTAHLSARTRGIDVSGIRRAFELGATLTDPINLSIGQPDFPVPDAIKEAAITAIREDRNGYTLTQGAPDLLAAIASRLRDDVGWDVEADEGLSHMVTSGTSGALVLAAMALCDPGDEIILPDPWFVIYRALPTLTGAVAVPCDTYPDMRMTAERIEPLLTDRTRLVILDSPGNPTGVVLSDDEVRDVADLCRDRGVTLLSDEIYDEFTFPDAQENGRCPSPARHSKDLLLVRGFGKTYGCTGWRLGYAAGPAALIREMSKLQQYTFVCAPSMAQAGGVAALSTDVSGLVAAYAKRRDMVMDAFDGVARVARPGGAFYAFVEVPPPLGISGTEFCERAIARNVIAIPGGVFSDRDTHVRLSFAVDEARLARGLDALVDLARHG